jgi:hypothetical protein
MGSQKQNGHQQVDGTRAKHEGGRPSLEKENHGRHSIPELLEHADQHDRSEAGGIDAHD